jgi:two-component system sensor histidine kinase KdpD
MLARLHTAGEEADTEKRRGRLKVFFGYAAGVGKTYAMLQAAQAQKAAGVEVVIGYVEPHGRPETEALLAGLEQLPVIDVPYRGTTLREFDLDAALARKPQLLLVDELAHTNAPGVRHVKRWQDVDELLAAGIDVYTTVNVQHVESLHDVIAQITGVIVHETIPDEVFNRADDVALIDLPPDELLERLQQGKVYIPAQAVRALLNFFRKENLVALRELSLRRTADRVHVDVQTARLGRAATLPWITSERLLVCLSPSPSSARVIRAAKRLADLLRAPWVAVHIETPRTEPLPEVDRQRLLQHLRLAERLGAETVTLTGDDVVQETIAYARARNVTKIVLGKTDQPRGRFWHRETIVDRLLRDSGNIDVVVVRGLEAPMPVEVAPVRRRSGWSHWLGTALVLAVATAIAWLFDAVGITEANLVMTYLLAVVVVATRFGAAPSVAASVLSVFLFDIFFTTPYYSVTVHDTPYLVTFLVMLVIGLLTSTLTTRIRRQADVSRRNERRTEALYRLSRQLTGLAGQHRLVAVAERTVGEVFGGTAVIFLPDAQGKLKPIIGHLAAFAAEVAEVAAAQWVFDRGQRAGVGTDTLPNAKALYLPLATPNGPVGVLGLQHADPEGLQVPEIRQLLATYGAQIALAIERDRLAEDSQRAQVQMEAEKLRSALLSSVSHDLRTPLAAIAGASSSLLEAHGTLPPETQHDLLETIYEESHRLTRLVENILHMTRLTDGSVAITKEWHPVDDVIGSALHRMARQLGKRQIITQLADDLPLGYFDAVLVEQVLMNLIDNAMKYSAPESPIEVRASWDTHAIILEIADRGTGIPPGDEQLIFEKFYRGRSVASDSRGAGLGLAICKAIVEAHGGAITSTNRPGGGAVFSVTLPFDGVPPAVPLDSELSTEAS